MLRRKKNLLGGTMFPSIILCMVNNEVFLPAAFPSPALQNWSHSLPIAVARISLTPLTAVEKCQAWAQVS